MSTTATLTPSPAAALDLATCDSCPQVGTTRYVLPSGLDLVLCGHHTHQHGAELFAAGASIEQVTR